MVCPRPPIVDSSFRSSPFGHQSFLFFSFLLCFISISILPIEKIQSQVYLQLEKANSLKTWKYQKGEKITFQTKFHPGYWQSQAIYEILPEDDAVFFGDRIVHISDFTKFQFERPFVNGLGTNVMRFGVAWFVFAGIIEGGTAIGVLETDYRFGTDTAIIGGTAILGGFLTKILWGKSVRPMNGNNRLRIIDVRF